MRHSPLTSARARIAEGRGSLGLVCALALGACTGQQTLALYPGPPRPQERLAVVHAPPGVACPVIRSADGSEVGPRVRVALAPGARVFDVVCKQVQPRDPLGGWRGHQTIRLELEAGHEYVLRAALKGAGRSLSYGNACILWFQDRTSGAVVGETLQWLSPQGPFGVATPAPGHARP